jgi:hypothetical protein
VHLLCIFSVQIRPFQYLRRLWDPQLAE